MSVKIGNKNVSITVALHGGTITHFIYHGEDIIFPHHFIGSLKTRGGIPVCFPFFGVPTEKFSQLPKHGWLRNQQLALINGTDHSVSLTGHNGHLTEVYPWQLEYTVTASITDTDGLLFKLEATRLDDGIKEPAPVNPGFHPYFSNLGKSELVCCDGTSKFVPAQKIHVIDLGSKKVKMTLSGDFNENSQFVLWSDVEKYFCVEPILGDPQHFDTPRGKNLEIGERIMLGCLFEVVE